MVLYNYKALNLAENDAPHQCSLRYNQWRLAVLEGLHSGNQRPILIDTESRHWCMWWPIDIEHQSSQFDLSVQRRHWCWCRLVGFGTFVGCCVASLLDVLHVVRQLVELHLCFSLDGRHVLLFWTALADQPRQRAVLVLARSYLNVPHSASTSKLVTEAFLCS